MKPLKWTAEQRIELEALIRPVVLWQLYPDLAVINLTGIFLPPHQRIMLQALHDGYMTTSIVASRGTSKTAVADVIYAGYNGLMFSGVKMVTLSATGFRGGQIIFEDAAKWINCGWHNQDISAQFMRNSMRNENVIKRAQNFWTMEFDSGSTNLTVPTNDPDKLRGIRGHLLFIDEANTIDWRLVTEVADSFLNVGTDFEHGGSESEDNRVVYTSTIDFNWRPYQEQVRASKAGVQRDMDAAEAQRTGNIERYNELRREGLLRTQYIQFDYTDVLVTEFITTRSGSKFKVNYPNPKIPLTQDYAGVPFSKRHPTGGMIKEGTELNYYRSYPIQKNKLEEKLFDGTAEESSWLAEQRNIVDTASGDVYGYELVAQAACEGPYSIRRWKDCPDYYKSAFPTEDYNYIAPVLWDCSDPCVMGIDYASQSDFSAFVVIRLGPCAVGEYNYLTHLGQTPWCNVIWAEQHKHTTHKDVADKARQLMQRYNIMYHHEPWLDDTWQLCRGIGLDMKGGGAGVRDDFARLNDEVIAPNEFRIYDPLDRDPRIQGALINDPQSKPMLDTIHPSPEANDRMVTFTVAQMEQKLMYIGKYLEKSQRPRGKNELVVGYDGVLGLTWQLRKLRQEPTASWRRFFVEGDTEKTTNKKDYWAAFCYASKQARAHIIRQRRMDDTPPPMGAIITRINSKGGNNGRAAGSRDSFDRYRNYRRL